MKRKFLKFLNISVLVLVLVILASCNASEDVITHSVTFDANNETALVIVDVEDGDTVEEPSNPTKSGFEFIEWQLNGSSYDFSSAIKNDITLEAVYDEIQVVLEEYTVTFNSVGGTSIDTQSVTEGNLVSEPNDPIKDAFVFENWLLDDEVYDFDSEVTSDLSLYAEYTYIGISDSPAYEGRSYNEDFDQLINNFESATLLSENFESAYVDDDQPYISIGYSGMIGNDLDGSLWKQAGSQNVDSAAFQYLVLRLRGFEGASIEDLSIGFRLDDNHEVLVVPFIETYDPDLQNNVRELDGDWYNYVISISDTLDGKTFEGKTGYTDVAAAGTLVGFHLMNTSEKGSGILELKDAYYTKTPNPSYPYEGSDYSQNKDYWSGTIGQSIGTYVNVESEGYYGEYLTANVNENNTHVVLNVKQVSEGILKMEDLSIQAIFADGNEGDAIALSTIDGMPESIGSGWMNLTIPFVNLDDGSNLIAGYKLINKSDVTIAISQSFLSYLGEYQDVTYPVLDFGNALIFDNFNRDEIGATLQYTTDNQVAIDNGFTYIISYSGMLGSMISEGQITFDSTGGDYVSYKVYSSVQANMNEYKYMVFKYKTDNQTYLNDLRMAQLDSNDSAGPVVYANQWQAGLGLPSIPEDLSTYPYVDGEWVYAVIDLTLTEGYSTDFYGFDLYYTGTSMSFDAIFFANEISYVDMSSNVTWADFEGLVEGTADQQVSEQQVWANVYDSATSIVADGEDNLALQLDGTAYAQYHTQSLTSGKYLAFDLRVETIGVLESLRIATTGDAVWVKDGTIMLANGITMVINEDSEWHHYVIDLEASGLELSSIVGIHADNGYIYWLDNLSWLDENPYYSDSLLWGSWDGLAVGDANGIIGSSQYWSANYGSSSSFVDTNGDIELKLDASSAYAQYHTGVMSEPEYISFDITVESAGSLGINLGGTHVWDDGLIGLDGESITLPAEGESAHIVIDVLASGLIISDEFSIQADNGAVYYIDDISFEWNDEFAQLFPVFEEDFEIVPVVGNEKYWWGNFETVSNGVVTLESADYVALRFGSPLVSNTQYISFDVQLVNGNNATEFRLELGDGNIVYFNDLVTDGITSDITGETMTVTIPLAEYVNNLHGIEVIGFHINSGGVIIDNIVLYQDEYQNELGLFTQDIG